MACNAIKPIVDGLEQELGDSLTIIRINVQSESGRMLAKAYNFQYTPTFVFFDASGAELWREVGGLDAQKVRDSLSK